MTTEYGERVTSATRDIITRGSLWNRSGNLSHFLIYISKKTYTDWFLVECGIDCNARTRSNWRERNVASKNGKSCNVETVDREQTSSIFACYVVRKKYYIIITSDGFMTRFAAVSYTVKS